MRLMKKLVIVENPMKKSQLETKLAKNFGTGQIIEDFICFERKVTPVERKEFSETDLDAVLLGYYSSEKSTRAVCHVQKFVDQKQFSK